MGVKQLWSFSKASTFTQCTWLYYLRYIKKIRVKSDNCYTWWGTTSHDIMQGFYEDAYDKYEAMAQALEDKIVEYSLLDDDKLKFPNEKEFESYIANLRHYFSNTDIIPYKVVNEKLILATFDGLEKYVFQGYIDSEFFDDDGNLVILDYKTSSISGFTGKKLEEKARQLIIYAIGISQLGRTVDGKVTKIPLDKIKIRYDMMKYLNITFKQKNGKMKTTRAERRLWVAHIANQIRKDFEDVEKDIEKVKKEIAKLDKKRGAKCRKPHEVEELTEQIDKLNNQLEEISRNVYDILQINDMVETAINENTLESLPQFIQDKYTVNNCYIDLELTEDVVNEATKGIVDSLNSIVSKSQEDNLEEAFTRGRIENTDSYYCANLCDMKGHCKFYEEYKEHCSMFLDKPKPPSDDEMLSMLGLI